MRSLYADWRAPGLTVCLHEHAGGYAFNRESMLGLADMARAAGAEIVTGVEVTGFDFDGYGAVTTSTPAPATSPSSRWWSRSARGSPRCGRCSACPTASTCASPTATSWPTSRCGPTGTCRRARSTFDPAIFVTDDGKPSPVLHVDSDQPLRADDGTLITERAVGRVLQARPRRASRAAPSRSPSATSSSRPLPDRRPSSPASPTCGRPRCRTASSASRAPARYRQARSGGVGAFTVDNFPVFDYMRPNVFVAADSNHGYKMIAVGREIARVLRRRALVAAAPVPLRALRHRATCTRSRTARTPGAEPSCPGSGTIGPPALAQAPSSRPSSAAAAAAARASRAAWPAGSRATGPCRPRIAASSPPRPNTGAATAPRSGSRSPIASA